MLDESRFTKLADDMLSRLLDGLEGILGDQADMDLRDGVLTIDLDAGGCYVINKHVPSRQIWLSSPVSGALHFDYDRERGWVTSRGDGTLRALLERELSEVTGQSVALD